MEKYTYSAQIKVDDYVKERGCTGLWGGGCSSPGSCGSPKACSSPQAYVPRNPNPNLREEFLRFQSKTLENNVNEN